MSTLKIWETTKAASGLPVIRLDERVIYQTVTFTGTAGTSAVFNNNTVVVTVSADANCAIRVGSTPTAVVTDYPLATGTSLDIEVYPGQKISAIAT